MAHFALLCRSDAGHVYPVTLVGRALRQRGHQVTLINRVPKLAERAKKLDLGWYLIEEDVPPKGKWDTTFATLRWIAGGFLLRHFSSGKASLFYPQLFLGRAPAALIELEVDGILADGTCQSVGTVAEHLGLPFVTVSAIPSNWEPLVPPSFTSWPYADTAWRRLRNRVAYAGWHFTYRTKLDFINRQRAAWNLPLHTCFNDAFSPLAQVSQMVEEFDFPHLEAPKTLHYVGSLSDGSDRKDIEFPWSRLDGRPLVYVMLTTVRSSRQADTYRRIAEICNDLNVQAVMSIGRWLEGSAMTADGGSDMPGNPILVNFAPQWSIIQRSALVICGGGVSTTMEALSNGVPVIAMPVSATQPGLAARLARSGAGLMLPGRGASTRQIRKAIERVLGESCFRDRAKEFQEKLADAGGAARAAEIAEEALLTGKPVLRNRRI